MDSHKLRVLFAGTSPIAVPALKELAKHCHLVGVLTSPDRKSGRGLKVHASAVKEAALEMDGVEVLQPQRLLAEARDLVSALKPDMMVVFAYGRIFGPKFLSLFPAGCINIHPSLLPRYRGPAPLTAAILNRDKSWGISIQKVALEVDSGDILASVEFPLSGDETTASLTDEAADKSALLIREIWPDIVKRFDEAKPQGSEGLSHVQLIEKSEGVIDWTDGVLEIEARIRAFQPWPRCSTTWKGLSLVIHKARISDQTETKEVPGKVLGTDVEGGLRVQCGSGVLIVEELQLQSKKRMDWNVFVNGNREILDSLLGGN